MVLGTISFQESGGEPKHVAFDGHMLYVADQSDITVYDLSNPRRPMLVGDIKLANVNDMAVGEGRLQVVNDEGLYVWKLGTPERTYLGFVALERAQFVEWEQDTGYNNDIYVIQRSSAEKPARLRVVLVQEDSLVLSERQNVDIAGTPTDLCFLYGYVFVGTDQGVDRFSQESIGRRASHLRIDIPATALETEHGSKKMLYVGTADGWLDYFFPDMWTPGSRNNMPATHALRVQDDTLVITQPEEVVVEEQWRGPYEIGEVGVANVRDLDISGRLIAIAVDNRVEIRRWPWGRAYAYIPMAMVGSP